MLEGGLNKTRAQRMKQLVEEYVISTVLPALISEENVSLGSLNEDNVFDVFGRSLLDGCAELELDMVCTR